MCILCSCLTTDPPEVAVIQPTESQFYVGSSVELVCFVSGVDPPTNVTWTSNDGTEVYSTDQPEGANITVLLSTRTDYGLYNCTATNDFGTDVGTIEIPMPGMPLFQNNIKDSFCYSFVYVTHKYRNICTVR